MENTGWLVGGEEEACMGDWVGWLGGVAGEIVSNQCRFCNCTMLSTTTQKCIYGQ